MYLYNKFIYQLGGFFLSLIYQLHFDILLNKTNKAQFTLTILAISLLVIISLF